MPNWTDENGTSHYGKLDCKRCLSEFETDYRGEVPFHTCLGGETWTSISTRGEHHVAVPYAEFKRWAVTREGQIALAGWEARRRGER